MVWKLRIAIVIGFVLGGGLVTSVLADPTLREGAKRMATVIAGYGGSADAVAELEQLASAR